MWETLWQGGGGFNWVIQDFFYCTLAEMIECLLHANDFNTIINLEQNQNHYPPN